MADREEPGVGPREIATRSGVRLAAAQWHLGRLEGAQRVGREKRGRRVHYFALGQGPSVPAPGVEVP